jgi:hypothetical protein
MITKYYPGTAEITGVSRQPESQLYRDKAAQTFARRSLIAACAAARRAMGTLKGEQET